MGLGVGVGQSGARSANRGGSMALGTTVDLAFLRGLAPHLLMLLVAPFGGELLRLGMSTGSKAVSPEWLKRLHRAIHEDGVLASALQMPLYQIAELATERGYRCVTREMTMRGIVLGTGAGGVTAADCALELYLVDRHTFDSARDQLRRGVRRAFREFIGPVSRAKPMPIGTRVQELRARLDSGFRQIGFAVRDIQERELSNGARLRILRAATARPGAGVRAIGRSDLMTSEVEDVIVYNANTGVLSISVDCAEAREAVRAEIGVLLANNRDHFQPWTVLSPEALQQKGTLALDSSETPGIKRVIVRAIYYSLMGEHRCTRGENVGPELDSLRETGVLARAEVLSWTLGFVVQSQPAILEVQFRPPNTLVIDEGMSRELLGEYLVACGLKGWPTDAR